MRFQPARAVADAVLFEGYALYPYRSSAPKNRLRWQFGVLGPRTERPSPGDDPPFLQTECLVELGEGPGRLLGKLRFMRAARRRVEAKDASGYRPVERLEVDGQLHLSWDEGVVEEIDFGCELVPGAHRIPFQLDGVREETRLAGHGRVVRESRALQGTIAVTVETAAPRCLRLSIRAENATFANAGGDRQEAIVSSLIGTHLLLHVNGAGFLSLIDPPAWAEEAARGCRSTRAFPVLAGETGRRDLVLASPILLEDHPRVAPESPGDFFDAAEIDELLVLRTKLLTPEEKREARATDPRVAALLDRVDKLAPEQLERLHGALREVGSTTKAAIGGIAINAGSRVRLRPGAGRAGRTVMTDAQDMFLDGMTAVVRRVEENLEGDVCLAVTVEDDPAAEMHGWYGRFHYFGIDEVEPIPEGGGP